MTTDTTTAKADLMARMLRAERRLAEIEAAASETVTEEMVSVAWRAYIAAPNSGVGAAMLRDVVKAVAPALLLAGERRALERAAADYERRADDLCAEADADDAADRPEFATSARERASVLRVLALELRALERPA